MNKIYILRHTDYEESINIVSSFNKEKLEILCKELNLLKEKNISPMFFHLVEDGKVKVYNILGNDDYDNPLKIIIIPDEYKKYILAISYSVYYAIEELELI